MIFLEINDSRVNIIKNVLLVCMIHSKKGKQRLEKLYEFFREKKDWVSARSANRNGIMETFDE